MNRNDIIGLISILIMLIGTSIVTYYIIIEKTNRCTSDPLKYTVEEIMKNESQDYQYIKLAIYAHQSDIIPFRSRTILIEKQFN